MKTFFDVVGDKNNHFNLMRMIAAALVLVGHNGVFRGAAPSYENFLAPYGISTAHVAVDVFFVISGFLVTASLFNRGSVIAFVCARFLRIFPGLWAMLLVVVFGIGLALTTVPAKDYLTSPLTWRFIWRWGTTVQGFAHDLPGLFRTNPFDQGVNGSLWTITLEVRFYFYLALGWVCLALAPTWRKIAFRIFMPLIALAIFLQAALDHNIGTQHCFCFFAGSTIYLHGDRIPVSERFILPLLAILAAGLVETRLFFYVYLVVLPYLTLNLAYAPGRWLHRYNEFGDYSYGMYIYAFPISQAVIALKPDIGVAALNLWSAPLTLVAAVLSWNCVEKRALARKDAMAEWATRTLRRLNPFFGGGAWPSPARPWRKPDEPKPREAERREPAL